MEIYNEDYTVYIHKNKINDKMYIGITKQDVAKRWGQDGSKYAAQYFGDIIAKLGWDNFEHIIFASNLTMLLACNMLKTLILKFNTRDLRFGYNIAPGGACFIGMQGEQNPFYQKAPEKAIQASIASRKGKHLSELHKRKISLTEKGRVKTKEEREKISKFMKRVGKERVGIKSQRKKPVQCIETGLIFPTQRMASLWLGVSDSAMKAALQRNTRCGGYHWKSVNKESLTTIMLSQVTRNGETLNESMILSDLHGDMQLHNCADAI